MGKFSKVPNVIRDSGLYVGNSSSNTQWTAFNSRGLMTVSQQATQVQGSGVTYAFGYTYTLQLTLELPSGMALWDLGILEIRETFVN